MPKNIVLLSDGTGNSAGKLQKTNVWRLFDALELPHPSSPQPPRQIAHYDDGVGSSSFKPYAIAGGALGLGLKRNVLDLYMFVCRNYVEGDSIYAFGFSRGAFTIRVLVGLINNQGLIRCDSEIDLKRHARDAFRRYRRRYVTVKFLQAPARALRDVLFRVPERGDAFIPSPKIAFVGLWDTVAAYGLPFDELTAAWNWIFPLSVPDRSILPNIDRAFHVLALDDERRTFHPVLWNEENVDRQNPAATHIEQERLTQVWFSGVHSNIGGGYPDDGLANLTLHWMMREAARLGLRLNPGALEHIEHTSDRYSRLYDSRRGLGGAYRYLPRKMSHLIHDINPRKPNDRVIIARPKIHESVLQRIANGTDAYAPIVLPPHYAVVTAAGAIEDMPSATLPPRIVETDADGVGRANRQEAVWNLVWWKRLFYFTSVFVALLLLAFPAVFPPLPACSEPLCSVAPLINALGMILPDIVKPWLSAYATHPAPFLVVIAVFVVLLNVGGKLQQKIRDTMRGIWMSPPSAGAQPPGDILYRVRTSPLYLTFWRHMRWWVLPALVGIPIAFLIIAMLSRAAFSVMSSAGAVCVPTPAERLVQDNLSHATFDPREVCWASGVELTKGVRYRITLRIDDKAAWKDASIHTGIEGFGMSDMTPSMYPGLPFRRYLAENWYRPIARIGETGTDEYVLRPSDALVADPDTTLVVDITARRTGELFLFVNDSVFAVPKAWQRTYQNNAGTATVKVVAVTKVD